MSLVYPEKCLRDKKTCKAFSQIASDCGGSFFCCGENDGTDRQVAQDRFTLCFKGPQYDSVSYNDKRDLVHQAAVILGALAIIEARDVIDSDGDGDGDGDV